MHDATFPRPLGDETEHYWLVKRMARATGTDVIAAAGTGRLDQEAWAAMIERCRGCTWTDECRRWLDRPEERTRPTPRPCLNRTEFEALRRTSGD